MSKLRSKLFSRNRKRLFLCVTALMPLAPLFASGTEVLALNQKKTQWHLQLRDQSASVHDFYFCPTAIKILDKGHGYSIVSRAPDWDVVLFRTDDKIYCRQSRNQYYRNVGFQPKSSFAAPIAVSTQTIGPVTAPLTRGPDHNAVVKKFSGIPSQVDDLISCYLKMDCVPGIRLRVTPNKVPDRRKTSLGAELFLSAAVEPGRVSLETVSLTESPYDEADFKMPLAFRVVKDVKQIKTGSGKRKEAEAIFLDMGVGDELGKAKSK